MLELIDLNCKEETEKKRQRDGDPGGANTAGIRQYSTKPRLNLASQVHLLHTLDGPLDHFIMVKGPAGVELDHRVDRVDRLVDQGRHVVDDGIKDAANDQEVERNDHDHRPNIDVPADQVDQLDHQEGEDERQQDRGHGTSCQPQDKHQADEDHAATDGLVRDEFLISRHCFPLTH